MMVYFIFACVSVCLTLLISYRTVNSILLEHAFSLGTARAELEAKEIDNWLQERLTLLESVAVQIENTGSNDEENIQKILEKAAKANPYFYSFFIGFGNGRLMDANGWIPPEEYNAAERPWYREALYANGITFTSAYIDKKKNAWVKAIAVPVHAKGESAVLAANIPFDTIRKQIQDIRFGETGYCILLDGDGIVLVYPDKDDEMKPLEVVRKDLSAEIQKNTWKNTEGTTILHSGGTAELLVHVPIQSNDWKLLLLAPIEEFQGPARKMSRQLMAVIIFLLGSIIFTNYLVGTKLSAAPEKEKEEVLQITGRKNPPEGDEAGMMIKAEKAAGNEASHKKEKYIAGTEEVYDIAGQIDEIAAQLEKGVRSFRISRDDNGGEQDG
ncbi:MAG TPA: cache domain-containing protein [Clostridia bacterium]|nr:cache domain-containing protein [Clostridia bacterium]